MPILSSSAHFCWKIFTYYVEIDWKVWPLEMFKVLNSFFHSIAGSICVKLHSVLSVLLVKTNANFTKYSNKYTRNYIFNYFFYILIKIYIVPNLWIVHYTWSSIKIRETFDGGTHLIKGFPRARTTQIEPDLFNSECNLFSSNED